jgi:putative acetyltransferase
MIAVRPAQFPEDAEAVLDIWREYIASPSVSLDYQGTEAEFAELPGKYGPPSGALLLAERDGRIVGCVGFRRASDAICEMKRLYVRPEGRGENLGRRLVERLLVEAKSAGYGEMRLDVLEEFEHARKLYTALGFGSAEPVSFNPVPGTSFMGRNLR